MMRIVSLCVFLAALCTGASAQTVTFGSPATDGFSVAAPDGDKIKLNDKGITLSPADGAFELRVGGRFHEDFGSADIRPASLGPPLSASADVRRAWLETTLTIQKEVVVGLQYDFSRTDQPINDAVISYKGLDSFIISLGNFKEPFSFDQLLSNNNTLFTERSLLDTFAPARNFGFAVGTHGERWTAVAGVFGGNANSQVTTGGVAGTARLTYAPVLEADQLLHFGLAGSYRSFSPGDEPVSFSTTPEAFLFGTSLVDTGSLDRARSLGRLGLEAVYQLGPVRVQSEYALTQVTSEVLPSSVLQAGYVEAAWVLNGPGPKYTLVPPYGSTYAILGGVQVPDQLRVSRGGIGVFELGARFSAIDLSDGLLRGGRERNVSAGLNWYPDKNIRLMFDYVRADATPSAASVTGARVSSNIFIGRAQVYW